MFDLGDELIIGSHRIPWLLWIQLLVMLLLVILLYCFAIIVLGADPSTNTASQPPLDAAASRIHNHKVGEEGTSTSTRRVEREGNSSFSRCSYFIGFAKQAFLRCLGLEIGAEDSSSTNTSRRKEE